MIINFKLRWQNDAYCTNRNGEIWRLWFYRKEKSANKHKVTRQSTGMSKEQLEYDKGACNPCRSQS